MASLPKVPVRAVGLRSLQPRETLVRLWACSPSRRAHVTKQPARFRIREPLRGAFPDRADGHAGFSCHGAEVPVQKPVESEDQQVRRGCWGPPRAPKGPARPSRRSKPQPDRICVAGQGRRRRGARGPVHLRRRPGGPAPLSCSAAGARQQVTELPEPHHPSN